MVPHVIPQCLVTDRIPIKLQLTGKPRRLIFKFYIIIDSIPDGWTLKTDIKFAIIGSSIRKIVRVFCCKPSTSIIIMNTCYLGKKRMECSRQHIIMKFVLTNRNKLPRALLRILFSSLSMEFSFSQDVTLDNKSSYLPLVKTTRFLEFFLIGASSNCFSRIDSNCSLVMEVIPNTENIHKTIFRHNIQALKVKNSAYFLFGNVCLGQ